MTTFPLEFDSAVDDDDFPRLEASSDFWALRALIFSLFSLWIFISESSASFILVSAPFFSLVSRIFFVALLARLAPRFIRVNSSFRLFLRIPEDKEDLISSAVRSSHSRALRTKPGELTRQKAHHDGTHAMIASRRDIFTPVFMFVQ